MKRIEFIKKSATAGLVLSAVPNLVFGEKKLDISNYVKSLFVEGLPKLQQVNIEYYKEYIPDLVKKWYLKDPNYNLKERHRYIQYLSDDTNEGIIKSINRLFNEAVILDKLGYIEGNVLMPLMVVPLSEKREFVFFIFVRFSELYFEHINNSGLSEREFRQQILK